MYCSLTTDARGGFWYQGKRQLWRDASSEPDSKISRDVTEICQENIR
jgi:hypothetical protein